MKYFVLVMLLSAGPAYAETETYLPLPDNMSIMGVGEITKEDLGEVTAGDLSKAPVVEEWIIVPEGDVTK